MKARLSLSYNTIFIATLYACEKLPLLLLKKLKIACKCIIINFTALTFS